MTPSAAARRGRAVGVLGGTFDPVHLGHLHAADAARRAFSLQRVLLVPCALPPHKRGRELTAASHRVAMLTLAAADHEGVEVSTVELDRGGLSYTLDTLREIAGAGEPPAFIMGADSLLEIRTWSRWRELLREFDVIVVDRPGRDLGRPGGPLPDEIASRLVRVRPGTVPEPPPGGGGRVYHLSILPVAVSSSGIRAAAAAGRSLSGLVPPAVARYIQTHRLYRQEDCC